jgi:hypothetical protein
MEHVPPEEVDAVLANIVTSARKVFFCISTVPDRMGALIGEDLHLTVQPPAWWRELLVEKLRCKVLWERSTENAAMFYVSAFMTFADIEHKVELNIEESRIRENIRANLSMGLTEIVPHAVQPDAEVMLLCGGPSLNDFRDEIVSRNVRDNMPAVTVNGTYHWLLQAGGRPGMQVVVDAREFNRRFVEPDVPQCRYAVSSQCDPALVAALPRERTLLWHGAGEQVEGWLREYAEEQGQSREWYPVPGGGTVTLRALPMLAMLGFRKIHVYGFDSCYRDGAHHAYAQPENERESLTEIVIDGRPFTCAPWMVKQADEFQALMRYVLIPVGVELTVYGDGLIAEILRAAAAAKE